MATAVKPEECEDCGADGVPLEKYESAPSDRQWLCRYCANAFWDREHNSVIRSMASMFNQLEKALRKDG